MSNMENATRYSPTPIKISPKDMLASYTPTPPPGSVVVYVVAALKIVQVMVSVMRHHIAGSNLRLDLDKHTRVTAAAFQTVTHVVNPNIALGFHKLRL
jgi:hypothetical protein